MKELLQNSATNKKGVQEKLVAIFIGSKEYEFSGKWDWDLLADSVYCSDVMLSFPSTFEGTKGLIHPDDKALVLARITDPAATVSFLQFRIITTYGEVKVLTGRNLEFSEVAPSFNVPGEVRENYSAGYRLSKQAQTLQWRARAAAHAERITTSGTWYLNTATSEMYYSDGVYHIYGLPPQSLNAHLHTFSLAIHSDERDIVRDLTAKSIHHQIPLHLEYNIQTGNGVEKKIRQTTHWEFNEAGELMLYGSVTDITEQTVAEHKNETAEYDLSLKSRLLQMNEQATGTGHWHINLLTRKIVYSDNIYRLHGLKPKSVPPGINIFLNYIHPEDREVVKEITKKIIRSHEPPDVDFRVVRPDGTIRYMRQRGKMVVYGEGEMVMIVSLQDITKEKITERKLAELNELALVKNFAHNQVETVAGIGSWTWDIETGAITWSDSLYHLLGYNPTATQLTYKAFLRFVHADDRKAVADSVELVLHEKKETAFPFRIIRLGEERFIQASFKIVANSDKELFIATLQDVTANQRLKEQLTKQVQLAESISQNIQDAVFITDENNNILLWNKVCEDRFKVKSGAALYQNFFDVIPALKEETTLTRFGQALKGQPVVLHSIRSAQGRGYHNLTMVPLRNDEGAVNGILHLLHDVTEEQEMQQRLTERLNFIERLLEASVDRIVVMDRHMNYLYCNQKAADHFGLSKEELIGKNVLEVYPSSINNPSYDYFRKALQGETVHIPAIDGLLEEHYGQIYLIPIKDDGGEVSAVLWIRQDLSGEIKLHQQLRKSDEILNSIDAAFIELDGDFRFRYVNPKGEEYLRKPKEELLGNVVWEVLPQVKSNEGYQALLTACRDKVKVDAEYYSPIMQKWVYMSATPMADGVLLLFYDRHNIREVQQGLREEHRRLQEAQAIGHIGSFEWNVGDEVVLWSDELYRINGMEPQSEIITTTKVIELIHPDDWEELQKIKEQSFSAPGIYRHIHRIVNPGGRVKYVHQQVECITDSEGRVIRVHGAVQDITDTKKAEEGLRKSLTILQQSEEVAQIGSWEYDVASGDFSWSDGMYRLFQLPKEIKVKPEIYLDFAVEEDRSIAKKIIAGIQQTNSSFDEVLRIKTAGEVRTVKVKSTVISNDRGKPAKVIGVDLDITDSVRAEKKIKESRHLLSETTAATPDAVSIFNLETKEPTYLNTCLGQWMGITNEELINLGFKGRLQLIHPDDRAGLLNFNQQMLSVADGAVEAFIYRAQKKDGTYLWLRNRCKVFKRAKDGKPIQLLSVLQDITKEVELHHELMKRTQFLEALVENNVSRISAFDRDLRIINWNRRCQEEMGLPKEEAIGKKFLDVFPQIKTDEEWTTAFDKAGRGEMVYFPFKKDIVSNRFLELFFIPLKDEKSSVYGILCVGNDVTGRVLNEEELKKLNNELLLKNKELEEKNEEITTFAFVASHDLKEPIRKLYTFSDWLLTKEDGLTETARNMASKIASSVKRLDSLIEDILVLTKTQVEGEEMKEVSLKEVMNKAIAELNGEIESSDAEIRSGDLPVIKGSANSLLHLFKNLINNSLKFQPEGNRPVVTITAGNQAPQGYEGKRFITISVQDNGIGFPSIYTKRIFGMFQRLHGRTEFEGTGMGLAICKKIMEKHGGFIKAESKAGEGALFTCFFPA